MIKVYILGSERTWLENMHDEFPWQALGCSVCGRSADGEMALKAMAKLAPDILIVDIQLPRGDGLKVCEDARALFPDMAILIVTAMVSFDAAVAAVNLGVAGYLPRPTDSEVMRRAIDRIASGIRQRNYARMQCRDQQQKLRDGKDFFLEKTLPFLFMGLMNNGEIQSAVRHLRLLDVNLEAGSYCCVLMVIGDQNRNVGDVERLAGELKNLSGDVLISTMLGNCICALVMGDQLEDVSRRAYAFARNAMTVQVSGASVSLASIGKPVSSPMDIHLSAILAERRLLHMPHGLTLAGPEELPEVEYEMTIPTGLSLYEQIRYIVPENLSVLFNNYIADLERIAAPEYVIANYIKMDALLTAHRIVRECGGAPEEILNDESCLTHTSPTDSIALCAQVAYQVLKDALDFRALQEDHNGNAGIARARYYLDHHYTDPGLMLKHAAREAGMSSSRFSTVFAQDTGRTFTEYVTGLRIEKARELLTCTDLRIAQIAAAVGYNDPHYFSWIFRKSTGMTPSECREAAHKEEK